MMKKLTIVAVLLIFSCKDSVKEKITSKEISIEDVVAQNNNGAEKAKKWLEKSIVDYFKADISEQDKIMKEITTKTYYEFKTEATNVDLDVDGSLTLKEFQKKWQNDYDINYAGINTGFLISAQDWIKIEVRKCEVQTALLNVFNFNVILADDGYKAKYFRNIKVVKKNDKFLIDGVIELN